jgi:hypothetical protein
MIDFFHEGSQVGFSINSVGGLILLFYVIIELGFFSITRTFLLHKLLISLRVWKQVKSTIPKWWKINKVSILTVTKKKNNLLSWNYECYVEVQSKYSEGTWTNDYVKTDKWGKIVKCDLYDSITIIDSRHSDKVKQYNRDNTLEKLGI